MRKYSSTSWILSRNTSSNSSCELPPTALSCLLENSFTASKNTLGELIGKHETTILVLLRHFA
jgi:uncharacterized protein (DUF2344 family)